MEFSHDSLEKSNKKRMWWCFGWHPLCQVQTNLNSSLEESLYFSVRENKWDRYLHTHMTVNKLLWQPIPQNNWEDRLSSICGIGYHVVWEMCWFFTSLQLLFRWRTYPTALPTHTITDGAITKLIWFTNDAQKALI